MAVLRSDGDWRSAKERGDRADPTRDWQQMGHHMGPRQASGQQPHRDQHSQQVPAYHATGLHHRQ